MGMHMTSCAASASAGGGGGCSQVAHTLKRTIDLSLFLTIHHY